MDREADHRIPLSVNVVKSKVNDERPNSWAESQVVTNSSRESSVCWRDE